MVSVDKRHSTEISKSDKMYLLPQIWWYMLWKVESMGVLAGVALTNMIPLSTPGQFGIFPTIARLVWKLIFYAGVCLCLCLNVTDPNQISIVIWYLGFRFRFDICRANHSCIPNANHYQVRIRALLLRHHFKLKLFNRRKVPSKSRIFTHCSLIFWSHPSHTFKKCICLI